MCSSCCCVVATVVRKRDRFVWVTHGRHGFRGFRNHDSTFAVDLIYKYHILQRETQKIGKNLSLMYMTLVYIFSIDYLITFLCRVLNFPNRHRSYSNCYMKFHSISFPLLMNISQSLFGCCQSFLSWAFFRETSTSNILHRP